MSKKDERGLTVKQKRYCQNRVDGMNQRQAYIKAGYSDKQKDTALDSNACNLERLPHIQKELARLQSLADNGAIITSEQRKQALTEIYLDDTKPDKIRLKALDMLNKMSGDYIDKKEINANVQGLTRADRLDAMTDALNALKSVWNDKGVEE